ncbi:MAG: sigma 54-interacting transcriptional regulator [Deltaproteobacteria bacterium]|nr:sigma 54-interacting transcriptional regulator [Deltaproteobacteria bacterium]
MELSDLTPHQRQFLLILDAFSESLPVEIVAELSGISAGDLHTLVRKLIKSEWLIESGESLLGLSSQMPDVFRAELEKANTPQRLSELLEQIKKDDTIDLLPPTAYQHLLVRCRQNEEAAELAYQAAMTSIGKARFDEALKHMRSCLSRLDEPSDNTKNVSLYIFATIRLLGLIQPRRKALDLLEDQLIRACRMADQMGDRRNQAFLSLYQGFMLQDRNQVREALDYLNSGLAVVKTLGDEEITARAAEFYGYTYLCRGLFRESSAWFERARSHELTLELKQFRFYLHFPIYFAQAAAFNGQFYRAAGVLDAMLQTSTSIGNPDLARLCRANLGSVLLMMGNHSEAYTYLENCLEESLQEEDLTAMVYSRRALAWYYFQEGDIHRSFSSLRDCLVGAEEIGSPQSFFAFPWILELLFEFHKAEYKSMDEEIFKREMAYAEKGINIMMQGIACRIRAKLAELEGKNSGIVRSLLDKSMSILIQSDNPIELAKTRAEMARVSLNDGDTARARDEALQAWMAFGYDGFSKELKPLIRSMNLLPSVGDFRKDWLTKYIELMSNLMPRSNEKEMMSSLIASTSQFFESERGGLFQFESARQFPTLMKGFNLAAADTEKKGFLPQLKLMKKASISHRPVVDTVLVDDTGGLSRESHVLCLPFRTRKLRLGVLYYDNTWSEGVYKTLDPAVLTKLTNHLGSYIDSIRDFSSRMKEISRQAIVQTIKVDSEEQEIVTRHPLMKELLNRARQVAPSEAPVLIEGETGVGKELLARFVHNNSLRQAMPFIAVNFASIPENLLESELFGHEKGAFTGAVSRKPGLIELADKGTLFIDEVGDIPKSIQVKLLRALQEKTFMRVGGVREYSSDFRIITATNREMTREVAEGNFREDLYYRINIVTLQLVPLRKRGHDITDLAEHFLKWYARSYNREVPRFSEKDRLQLLSYRWPGNVRELKNVIEQAVLLSTEEHLDLSIPTAPTRSELQASSEISFPDDLTLEEIQRLYIDHILKKTGGKMSGAGSASSILGLNRSTLYSRMRKMGMNRVGF